MEKYEFSDAAARAGVSVDELRQLVGLGILRPDAANRLTSGDVRRVGMVDSLTAAGIPLDGLGAAIRNGQVSLDFLDEPAYERFSALGDVTFVEFGERAGIPVPLLMLIREAAGSPPPRPDDLIRDDELPYATFIEAQVRAGVDPAASQGLLRVQGESLRRMAETETAWWRSEVIMPAVAAGKRPDEILGAGFANRMTILPEQAILGMYHLQQAQAWTGTIIESLEMQLTAAGLSKWLGDGFMLFFPDPGRGVVAALEMSVGVAEAGLPPAHVGLHAGPVIFQDGDYYGQTVNLASRIADYARPGEVLVSEEVVAAAAGAEVVFREIGPVELQGVAGAIRLHAATRPG